MKDGALKLVIGSPGGSRIIGYVAKAIIGYLDWELDVQKAVDLPNLVNRFGTFDIESGTSTSALADALKTRGYKIIERGLNSGLHIIARQSGTLSGGADKRREGIALGH